MTPRTFAIPVAHTEYAVVVQAERPVCDGEAVDGYVDRPERTIYVWGEQHDRAVRATLWHEYFHAVLYELGAEDLCDDEAFVEGLAFSLMRVRLNVADF